MSAQIRLTAYCIAFFALVTSLATSSAQAARVGPYTAHANTMHQFHFNETANPIMDAPAVANDYTLDSGPFDGGKPGTLGHTAYSPAFGAVGRTIRTCCSSSTGILTEERGWT